MLGRWLSGCPLGLSPDKDDSAIAADPQRRKNFGGARDEQGLLCPISALRTIEQRLSQIPYLLLD